MTVSSQVSLVDYTLNGATTAFAVPFYFILDSDLQVWTLDANGISRVLALNTDYTVAGAGDEEGGTVTTTTALNNATLYIQRIEPLTQETDYPPNTPFPASSHERALDKLTMICQQLQQAISETLSADPLDPNGPFNAHGRRIVNLGDAIGMTDAVNLETLLTQIATVNTSGLLVVPQIWKLTPDGVTKNFLIPGADVSQTDFYDVLVNGTMIEPDDGYTIQISADADGSSITFTTAPAANSDTWVVLRGYAKPASDYVTTLINDAAFQSFLTDLITNTLYGTTSVLKLGPTKFLIPLADVDADATIDRTSESYLLRSTSAADVNFTVRANTGDTDLDWETNPIAAAYFSVEQVGGGQVTLVADTGVTLKCPPGFQAKTRGKNAVITATADYAAGGQWVLSGDLAPSDAAAAIGSAPTVNAASDAGVLTLDLADGQFFAVTLAENITSIAFTNPPPAGNACRVYVQITQNASAANTVAWPASFKWAGGTVGAVSTTASYVDFLELTTFDGGTSWLASIANGNR